MEIKVGITILLFTLGFSLLALSNSMKITGNTFCITCGKKNGRNSKSPFCSDKCKNEIKNTNWQSAVSSHKKRERDFLISKNKEKWGNWLGGKLPVNEYLGERTMCYFDWKENLKFFNNSCVFCGVKQQGLQYEHLFRPCSEGGQFSRTNILPSCAKCNQSKGSKSLLEYYEFANVPQKYRDKIAAFKKEPFFIETALYARGDYLRLEEYRKGKLWH